jgi:hypothetical protein
MRIRITNPLGAVEGSLFLSQSRLLLGVFFPHPRTCCSTRRSFYLSFSASANERVLGVEFTDDALSVSLRDGRIITVPLAWHTRLLNATPAQLQNWKIAGGGYGLHWPDLDEDLGTEGSLRGSPS